MTDRKNHAIQQDIIITDLKRGYRSIKQLELITNLDYVQIRVMLQNIKRKYDLVIRRAEDNTNKKEYFIQSDQVFTRDSKPSSKSLYDYKAISDLPEKIHRNDLIQWHLDNPIIQFKNVKELIHYAQVNGKKVYCTDSNGNSKLMA